MAAEPTTVRVDFVTLEPTGVLVRNAAVPEPISTAVIGVTLGYATAGLPDEVGVDWTLFADDDERVPLLMTDPSTQTNVTLGPAEPTAVWHNTLSGSCLSL